MSVPLSYGIKEEKKGVPLDTGIKKRGVDLSYGLDIKPKNRFEQYRNPQPASFGAKHPNLYGMYGAGKEVVKFILPYVRYIDPDERQRFLKLSQQHQTRELLLENLNAILMTVGVHPETRSALKPVSEAVKATMQRLLPKTFNTLTKARGMKIPKFKTTGEAVKFGEKATPAQIKELQRLWEGVVAETKAMGSMSKLMKDKAKLRKFNDKTQEGALYKEAYQAAKGRDFTPYKPAKAKTELPKYAGSINLQRQAISNEAKRAELELFQKAGVKTTQSHSELIKEALQVVKKFESDPKFHAARIEKIKAGHTPSIKELTAHRIINAREQDALIQMAKGVDSGTVTKKAFNEFKNKVAGRQLNIVDPTASDAGRRLSSFNIMVGRDRAFKALNKLVKPLNKRQRKMLQETDMDDPVAVAKFVKDLPQPKYRDYFYEYWYNSILSGLPTHVVNITTNTGWRMFQVPHRALTAPIDAVISTLTGRARTRYLNETIPLMAGFLKGKGKAARSAWDMARYGKIQAFETKWAQEMGSSLGAWDKAPFKAVRGIGKAITPPTKALRAMDVYGNSLAFDGQMNALARRTANLKGIKGAARKEFETKFVKDPPKWAYDKAMEFAKYTTFMSDPGWISKMIISARNKIPLESGRLVVPFVNTIGNLTKRGVEMTPGIGLFLARGQNPAEVAAKQIEGAIVSFYALNLAAEGRMSGGLPENKAERDAWYRADKKPWAIKYGDTWYEYRRIEPFNTVLSTAAIAYDKIKNAKDEETASKIFFNMANAMKNNFLDSGYMQGMTRILNRHGGAETMAPRLAGSFVPYSSFLRSINRAYEVATEGSAKIRDGDAWHKAFSETTLGLIPGLPKLPVKLNVWGEEIDLQGGMFRQWLPYRWSKENDDITEKSLEKLKVYPGLPRKNFLFKRKRYDFDEDIHRNYIIKYGKRAKEYLDIKFSQPLWQKAMKDESKHAKIKSKIDSKLKSLRYKEKRRAIREQRRRWKNTNKVYK